MTTTSILRLSLKIVFYATIVFVGTISVVWAQNSLTLSVSPALYDLPVEPSQVLNSSIRVINPNPFDITIYTEVVNFKPQGEGGDGQFYPLDEASLDGSTLAEWVKIDGEPISIKREQSLALPFSIVVPEDASPGGHFAAILIGTRPLRDESQGGRIQTAQIVTSLLFLRVSGDVVESGLIREFTTSNKIYSEPAADFMLRFENRGNVHLQPQGEIKITNMWGNERGIIPINQSAGFGNVLPDSVRQFIFNWRGEWSPSDIGKYTAEVTLAYGSDERQFTYSQIDFWVLPLDLILKTILGIAIFIGFLIWLIRLYVRRMLRLAGVDIKTLSLRDHNSSTMEASTAVSAGVMSSRLALVVLALRQLRVRTESLTGRFTFARAKAGMLFLYESRLWYLIVAAVALLMLALWWFLKDAKDTDYRAYEIGYVNQDQVVIVSSEELVYNRLRYSQEVNPIKRPPHAPISIINRGGVPGQGAKLRLLLEKAGFEVAGLKADFTEVNQRTVIVASNEHKEIAIDLSRMLNNAPVSLAATVESGIQIYVGNEDFDF